MIRKNFRAALFLRTTKSDQTAENQRLALEEEAGTLPRVEGATPRPVTQQPELG